MSTALQLLTDSVQKIGVYAPGEPLTSADSTLCLSRLTMMLDQWSNQSLASYANTEQNFTLVPGQYRYTIGTSGGADINQARPLRILDSPGTAYVVDTNGNRYNLEVVTQDRWNLIWNITQVSSDYPNSLFYDPQFPLGIINLYPVPTIGWTLYFDSRIQFTDPSTLTTQITLPPGYEAAITDNLAIELWPYFKQDGSAPPPYLLALASRSLGWVKRTNTKPTYLNYDPEIVSRGNGVYNVYSDSARSGGVI